MNEPTPTFEIVPPVDIVERLRVLAHFCDSQFHAPEIREAADTIETLRTMIDHPEVLAMLAGPGGSTCTMQERRHA